MRKTEPAGIGVATAFGRPSPVTTELLIQRLGERLPGQSLLRLSLPLGRAAERLDAAVVVTAPDDPRGQELRRDPLLSPPLRTLFLSDGAEPGAVEKLVSEIFGWIRAVKLRPPLGPRHLRPRLGPQGAAFSRRDLLTAVTGIRHDVVPAVEASCVGSERCGLCLASCPAGAIAVRDGRAVIDQRRCTGCGRCVSACPVDAIRFPGGTREEINACLEGILAGGSLLRIVAFTCARWTGALPPPYLECALPCIGLLSPWAILRAMSLGAQGVAIVTGDSPCRDHHDRDGLERCVRAARQILEGLGVKPERVAVLDALTSRQLSDYRAAVAQMSPTPWKGRSAGGPPLALGTLVARLAQAADRAETRLSPEVPFASVEVDPARCSLCGLCVLCPTGAIARQEAGERIDLAFHYLKCTGCGVCRGICPEKAIRLTRVFIPARLGEGPRPLIGAALVRCESCRDPIAPAAMLEALARRITSRRGDPGVLEGISRLCPACRLAVPLGGAPLPQVARSEGEEFL